MMKDSLKVAPSTIHGTGLFATRAIPKGTLLGHYRTRPTVEEGMHTIWPDGQGEPEDVVCRFRFVNHSAEPNLGFYEDYSVWSLRDIEAGEELTFHYGSDWE